MLFRQFSLNHLHYYAFGMLIKTSSSTARANSSAETYNEFFQAWIGIVQSRDAPEYQNRLHQFSTKYSDTLEHQECVHYVQDTWLSPGRVESVVQAWTNKHPHFGVTVTSRLVSISVLFQGYFTY
jgi:hypothetical protein